MTEKYQPIVASESPVRPSGEETPNTVEIFFPPQPVYIPVGLSVTSLLKQNIFAVPDTTTYDEYDKPEAFIAALEVAASTEATSLECIAVGKNATDRRSLPVIVAEIDPVRPWRLARLDELMAFGMSYPELLSNQPLLALGAKDVNHYPVSLMQSGAGGPAISTYMGGLGKMGTRILLVRELETVGATVPTIISGLTADSFKSTESYQQKIEAFVSELATFSAADREQLSGLTNVHELLGARGAELQALVGDRIFDRSMDIVTQARLKNVPNQTGQYEFTLLQLE
jgi:hypothetical protein